MAIPPEEGTNFGSREEKRKNSSASERGEGTGARSEKEESFSEGDLERKGYHAESTTSPMVKRKSREREREGLGMKVREN